MGTILIIGLVILGIYGLYLLVDFISFCKKYPDDEKSFFHLTDAQRAYYYKKIDEIMKLCWDQNTYIFNWNIWFDRRDEVIWCGDENVLKTIDSDFRAYGCFQVWNINACLGNSFESESNDIREDMVMELKSMENSIILNLRSMFSYENGRVNENCCPEIVSIYRDKLYRLLRGEIDWTRENINKIIELGDSIT